MSRDRYAPLPALHRSLDELTRRLAPFGYTLQDVIDGAMFVGIQHLAARADALEAKKLRDDQEREKAARAAQVLS